MPARLRISRIALAALATLTGAALAACGSADAPADDGRPTVVVTTSILGDVVQELVGAAARVEVVMPAGADPHDFQASAQQVAAMRSADAVVTNGGGFETGLGPAIEAAEADVPTVHALDLVEGLAAEDDHGDEDGHAEDGHGEEGHAEDGHAEDGHAEDGHAEDGHADDEGAGGPAGDEAGHADDEGAGGPAGDEAGHEHAEGDPHFFTDPERMADAAEGIAGFLAEEVSALATDATAERAATYVEELRALAAEVDDTLAPIPAERRVIVTNHDVFGYFADRYGFEVVGVVVPGGGTGAEPSAGELDELARIIEEEGVPAIFADSSAPARLAETLAAEVGGEVEVVSLFTEALGDEGSGAETYTGMVRTNAERIAEALA